MKRYRLAVILGIISTICLVSSYGFHSYYHSATIMKRNALASIRSTQEQRKGYAAKIAALKPEIPKLMVMAQECDAAIEYEVEIRDKDVKKLMRQVMDSYAGQMFFLENGLVESTPQGITVTIRGFKAGKPETPQTFEEDPGQPVEFEVSMIHEHRPEGVNPMEKKAPA